MAEDQENGVEAEEELDIDALLDDVADGSPTGEAGVDGDELDSDGVLDDALDDLSAADAGAVDDDIDAIMDEVAMGGDAAAAPSVAEPVAPVAAAEPPAAAPAPSAAPAVAPAVGGSMDLLLGRLTAAVEKSEFITQQLEERHSAAERFVKGVKEASKELKEDQASIGDVEKSSKLGMILTAVTLLLSGAILGLVVIEDRERVPTQVETVSASVDGVSENVNLIAGRIFEQQEQMDQAMSSFASLKEALEKIPQQPAPAPVAAPQMMAAEAEGGEPAAVEVANVAVDFTAVEEKIDETQQKILALHQQLKGSEARLPELKAQLEQLLAGQQQLRQEQQKLMQLQQMMLEAKVKGKSIYKFP
jgi:hypothetical protein